MSEPRPVRPRVRFFPQVPDEFLSHLKAARQESRQALQHIMPDSFWAHRQAARREALLAARSLIDAALERVEKKA